MKPHVRSVQGLSRLFLFLTLALTSCQLFDSTAPQMPVFSWEEGVYYEPISVEITGEEKCTIYYTTDGSDPAEEGTEYAAAVLISRYTVLKAVCMDRAGNISETMTATYRIDADAGTPVVSPADGTYTYNIMVTVIADANTAVYYTYTTDLSEPPDPTKSDTPYGGSFLVSTDYNTATTYRYKFKAFTTASSGTRDITESDIINRQWTIDGVETTYEINDVDKAYLDVAGLRILNGTYDMNYSLDDGGSWTACTGAVTDVVLSAGDEVWVQDASDTTIRRYLGRVEALSGRADLIADECNIGTGWFSDYSIGSPGDTVSILVTLRNIGNTVASSLSGDFYLSVDPVITPEDTFLAAVSYSSSLGAGESLTFGLNDSVTIPEIDPGTYYVGVIVDPDDEVSELTDGNNASRADLVDEYTIIESSGLSSGAVKIVNSWGTGSWENQADGHYWLTYDTMKSLQIPVRYYYDNFSDVYEPTVIAVFRLTDLDRDGCVISLGLGSEDDPFMEKTFQSTWSTYVYSGDSGVHEDFPANDMVLDISEFAAYINDYDVFLRADNSNGDTSGSLSGFSVEFYSDYDAAAFLTVAGSTGAVAFGGIAAFTAETAGKLNDAQVQSIIPMERGVSGGVTFMEEQPTAAELFRDKAVIGVYREGRNYNVITPLGFGTGDVPPTEEQWDELVKLRDIETSLERGTFILPDEVDNSAEDWFPPIGNQGDEGSCTCFSFGYYIATYTEAREHGWDLSSTSWDSSPYPGAPDGNLDKIMSPDFIYHQINQGGDNGSNGHVAASFIVRLGCSSWDTMAYDDEDSTTWPDADAFREAPRYRGREVGESLWETSNGYFIIREDGDIELLKKLLHAGYCVSTAVKADSGGIYDYFDSNDVVSGYSGGPMVTNHANTIVGYKEGSAWNGAHPDE